MLTMFILTAVVFLAIGLACPYLKTHLDKIRSAVDEQRLNAEAYSALMDYSGHTGTKAEDVLTWINDAVRERNLL